MLKNFHLLLITLVLCLVTSGVQAFMYLAPLAGFQEESEKAQESKSTKKEEGLSEESNTNTSTESTSKSVLIQAPIDALEQQEQDLQHYLTQENIKPLLSGPDDFFTLLSPSTTSNNKGVLILLPNWQLNATSPTAINFLRQVMPSQGWTTMTIQPPSKPDNYPSKALNENERVEENNKTLLEYREKLSGMMAAVLEQAKNYPGIFVVVSEGSHASLIVEAFNEEALADPSALVILSSYLSTNEADKSLAKSVAASGYPILDLYLKKDHYLVAPSALLRKQETDKEMKVDYRQKQLYNMNIGYYPEQSLLKEINGWLKFIGW